ncbi:MAG TPA: cytochrome c oxidase subunit 3 [Cyclobacteriaceae bacterium]
MATEIKIVEEAKKPLGMHPKKFAMWLFIVTVCMLFAAWTSAYIVKRAEAGWAEVVLPSQFYLNSIVVVLSSFTMIWAQLAAKRNDIEKVKLALVLTTILGIAFLIGQWMAWGSLVEMNEHFSGGNVSHSFLYVLTGIHALHIIGGLIFILVTLNIGSKFHPMFFVRIISAPSIIIFLIMALRPKHQLKVNSKNLLQLELCATFWHFLSVLWLYLFFFLLLNK